MSSVRFEVVGISETILKCAKPLLHADPSGPPDIAALSSIMKLAAMCWNLPVSQKEGTLAAMPQMRHGRFDNS